MPRPSKPWYREQTKSWYVKIARVSHLLGKHPKGLPPVKDDDGWNPPKEIEKAWHRLMGKEGLSTPVKNISLTGLIEEFLVDAQNCPANVRRI